jgi:hypothetical protein
VVVLSLFVFVFVCLKVCRESKRIVERQSRSEEEEKGKVLSPNPTIFFETTTHANDGIDEGMRHDKITFKSIAN